MSKSTFTWSQKGIVVVVAILVAFSCAMLTGCKTNKAENPEESVRQAITTELDVINNPNEEAIQQFLQSSKEASSLTQFGLGPEDTYKAMLSDFSYEIESIKVDGTTATANIVFTTKDLMQLGTVWAQVSDEAEKAGKLKTDDEAHALMIETIKGLPTITTSPIKFQVIKSDDTWKMAENSGQVAAEALFPSSVMAR